MSRVQGSCHCGAIRFEAPAPTEMTTCTCTYCDRVGALWAYCPPGEFTLSTPPEAVSEYRFGHHVVAHHHCAACGCATHGKAPDFSTGEPDFDHPRIGWNVRMAHDFDRSDVPVSHVDGRNDW